jgi:hypothetical protein
MVRQSNNQAGAQEMTLTTLQRRTLAYLATVDSATTDTRMLGHNQKSARDMMGRLIAAGYARNISTRHRCLYQITIAGRQAIAPPLVCVAWKGGQSAPLKPSTAEALRVRLDAEMEPGTHWIVPE